MSELEGELEDLGTIISDSPWIPVSSLSKLPPQHVPSWLYRAIFSTGSEHSDTRTKLQSSLVSSARRTDTYSLFLEGKIVIEYCRCFSIIRFCLEEDGDIHD